MSLLSDNEIDSILTASDDGRTATIDPGGANELPDVPIKFDDPSQRQDVAAHQTIVTKPQMTMRVSASVNVKGGHQNGTQILDDRNGQLYRAFDVLRDDLYAIILLTEV